MTTDETTTLPSTEAPAPGDALELETTASPALETSPEDQQTEEQQPEKTYTQAELDAIIGKRLARERRSIEREFQARQSEPAPTAPEGELSIDQFESPEAYARALAAREAEVLVAQRTAATEQQKVMNAHDEREEKARERFEDYDTVVKNPNLAISPAMASVIVQSDMGPDVIYHLGQNPDEALRIYHLPPFLQAKELGRLESKLALEPPTRRTSSAPAPITPIRTPASKPTSHDPTDPRSIETMSTSEWIAAENKRERARLEARFH